MIEVNYLCRLKTKNTYEKRHKLICEKKIVFKDYFLSVRKAVKTIIHTAPIGRVKLKH